MNLTAVSPAPDGWISVWREGWDQPIVWVRCEADEHGGVIVKQMMIQAASRLTATTLRSISPGRIEATINGNELLLRAALDGAKRADPVLRRLEHGKVPSYRKPRKSERKPLQRPDGSDPDAFYAEVAQAYREYVNNSNRPAVFIAEEAGVPVATARRWISEARRRGQLPPGEQGRAR